MREVWTDDELDRALDGLYHEIQPDHRNLGAVRATVVAAAEPRTPLKLIKTAPSQPRPLRRLAAAAAAILAIAVVVQTTLLSPSTATAEARETLTTAADIAARTTDPPVANGQYRYVTTHAWWMKTIGAENNSFSFLNENLIETWIPADPVAGEWLQRRRETGNRKWVKGTEAEARAAGAVVEESPWPEQRAKGGAFTQGLPDQGTWQFPKPQFLAGLPADPEQLYERLRTDSGGGKQVLVYVADALRTGLVPAHIRANLLRALTHLPGLDVTDNAADLDGRKGVALGMSEDGERQEIILDPTTGEVIGERKVSDSMFAGIPKGTVTSYSSVTTTVVDTIGTTR
ncbi:CU044_5270 family protein [Saccharothrix sp.]|uniref:CU044_5270 family protein n=1 Tax=Saccharothrix sp. TaxID=1873460 RepID=UPI002810A4EF|nr:CU044_5270 family protein [Saccharothrix sp.]